MPSVADLNEVLPPPKGFERSDNESSAVHLSWTKMSPRWADSKVNFENVGLFFCKKDKKFSEEAHEKPQCFLI